MKYWREKETKTMKALGFVAKGMLDIRWIFSLFIIFIFIKDLRNWIMT
tara:strand:- start:2553 stop:2696 length:144 start_codon:yes stop_codon:yes gene_type:complete